MAPRRAAPRPTAEATAPPQAEGDPNGSSPATFTRLSINIARSVADALKTLTVRHETTVTEEVRRAVSVWKALDDRLRDGGRVLITYQDGRIVELEFPEYRV